MKIAILGVGSFVFGPSALYDAIVEHRLAGAELALCDLAADVLDGMAGVARRLAKDAGVDVKVTTHTDRTTALEGADFVLCSVARELFQRFETDRRICQKLYPNHMVTEFGGVAGVSYSLRQIALIDSIAADMLRLCPKAWLLNVSNPLPRVCQAAHEAGIKTAGFCMASLSAYDTIWRLLHGGPALHYPFEPARSKLAVTAAGVNHFSFALQVHDAENGHDLLPAVRAQVARQVMPSLQPLSQILMSATGYLPMPGDAHCRDFVTPRDMGTNDHGRDTAGHGTVVERGARIAQLRRVADGAEPVDVLLEHRAWEKPIDFVAGLTGANGGKPVTFTALNLVNDGQLFDLPRGVFVETPVTVSTAGPQPQQFALPGTLAPMVRQACRVTNLIVQAARSRSKEMVHKAVESDPTVLDSAKGLAAIDACMEAHADVLPRYS
jgi:alpha-galactosidase